VSYRGKVVCTHVPPSLFVLVMMVWRGQRGDLAPSLLPQHHVDPSHRSLGLGVVHHVAGLIDGSRSEVSTRIWR
jgi:hypothetical protein